MAMVCYQREHLYQATLLLSFATRLTNMFDVLSRQIPLQIGALTANLGIAKCTVLNGIVLQHKEKFDS